MFLRLFLALSIAVGLTGAAKVKVTANAPNHAHHLHNALNDVLAAEAAAKAGNKQVAEAAIRAAENQVKAFIATHHATHHVNSFIGGSQATHHQHHTHLQRAEADLHAAMKQVAAGHVKPAEHDLARAATQIRDAIKLHHS